MFSKVPGIVITFSVFLTFERARVSPNFVNSKYSFCIGAIEEAELDELEDEALPEEREEFEISVLLETSLEDVSGLLPQEVMRREAAIRNNRLRCMGSP